MKLKVIHLFRIFFSKQFITFLLIGGINTLNGLIIPTLFAKLMQANIAYAVSYIPNLGISYILNSIFTFHERKLSFEKCIKFYLSYVPNFLIQNIIFFVSYNLFHANKFVGIVLASVLGIPVTFLILKFFAFSQHDNASV